MQAKIAEVQKYITNLAYPCNRKELVAHVRKSGAHIEIIRTIQNLPFDYFTTPYDVRDAMKQ